MRALENENDPRILKEPAILMNAEILRLQEKIKKIEEQKEKTVQLLPTGLPFSVENSNVGQANMKKPLTPGSANHHDHAREIQREIYGKMTYAEKWEEAMRLRRTAVEMKRAFLVSQHPEWTSEQTDNELRKIFLYAST